MWEGRLWETDFSENLESHDFHDFSKSEIRFVKDFSLSAALPRKASPGPQKREAWLRLLNIACSADQWGIGVAIVHWYLSVFAVWLIRVAYLVSV